MGAGELMAILIVVGVPYAVSRLVVAARSAGARTAEADDVKRRRGATYWPLGAFGYPLLAFVTFGVGLWVVWARNERLLGTWNPWSRTFGWLVVSAVVPFAFLVVLATYGRNLHYLTADAPASRRARAAERAEAEAAGG